MVKRIRIPLHEDTESWDIMSREGIEEEFSEEYEWTGEESFLTWVKIVNAFSESFRDHILGFLAEFDEIGEVVRITALTCKPGSKTLALIDIYEWLKSRGIEAQP